MKSTLVKLLGFPATLMHADTLVLDRWLWLKHRLPKTANGEQLIDIGCGSGSFTIGASLRGYEALGLSYDQRNQDLAQERAVICKAPSAAFETWDVRKLDERPDLLARFDVAICFENIEHILDDRKLMRDMAACIKPGGRLLLTTPNFHYKAITPGDDGPFSTVEDGWHVKKGYTGEELMKLCEESGIACDAVSFCSGFLSQKITYIWRASNAVHPLFAWGVILPLRILPPVFDTFITRLLRWPQFSICLEAHKPQN